MKKIVLIIFILLFSSSYPVWGNGLLEDSIVHRELKVLVGEELSEAELLRISGQGSKVTITGEAEGVGTRVILWDEAHSRVTAVDVSVGQGNLQSNTLSIQGR